MEDQMLQHSFFASHFHWGGYPRRVGGVGGVNTLQYTWRFMVIYIFIFIFIFIFKSPLIWIIIIVPYFPPH